MASFDVAYNWMMDNEDPTRACEVEPDYPPGSHVIAGINSAKFPTDFAAILAIAQSQRGPSVQNFYRLRFWNASFSQLNSDDVAKRVFDEAVNAGPGTAVKQLQIALGAPITIDGAWGPATIGAANSADPDGLVARYIAARKQHYRDIAAANPEEAKYLKGWLIRAGK